MKLDKYARITFAWSLVEVLMGIILLIIFYATNQSIGYKVLSLAIIINGLAKAITRGF